MKVLVMGAGAVGGFLGGMLSRSGEQVTLVEQGEYLEAINRDGLRVESATAGAFTVHPLAVVRPDGSWKADMALFCVKSYQNKLAIETMRPAIGGGTTILTLQNGIGNADQLADAFGRDKVLFGAIYLEAMRKGLGIVEQVGGPCRVVFGEGDGRETPRALEIRDAFQRAGIDCHLSPEVSREVWNKLIFICALSGMTCIARASFAEVLDTPETLDLTWRVMREAAEVGRAKGVNLDDDIVESTMSHFQELKHELISSMYLDLQSGNPLELDVLNGGISRLGAEVGVPTPVNDFIAACLAVAHNRASGQPG